MNGYRVTKVVLGSSVFPAVRFQANRQFSLTSSQFVTPRHKRYDNIEQLSKRSEGTDGEETYFVGRLKQIDRRFPTPETFSELFDGVAYSELPVVHAKISKNNTKVSVTTAEGLTLAKTSAGAEGFKNCRKGTNVAGQAAGISIALKALKLGVTTVRVYLKGFGPGRMTCVKGMHSAGLKIASIADLTPLPELGPRPRKARRI